jgi:endonuclease/exonuclease/phosphatase family metal-dependent hydrolase
VRVLTYNVHGWLKPSGESNVDQVARIISAAQADVVGLNEVFHLQHGREKPPLDELAARLGMHYAFGVTQSVDPQKHPPYGNALLSRWAIMAHAAHHLAPAVSYGKRGMLECRLILPSGAPLTVYVTHLDHRSEQIRVEQWAAANTWLLRDRNRPHLLLGDFNALAETDYPDPAALARLKAYQAERGWPTPAFDLVGQVLKSGYIDCFVAAGNPAASGATLPPDAPERRIDYVFLPALMRPTLRSCAAVVTPLVSTASDHLPVLAEIDL